MKKNKSTISESRRKYLRNIKLNKIKIITTQILILIVIIAAWEILARMGKIDSFITSQPSRILKTFANLSSNNLLEHLKHIDKAEVTMGLRCGYMSPTPYVEFNSEVKEEDFKTYIEAVSNEAVSWDYIKKQMDETKGITYADKKILEENKAKILPNVGKENWLLRFRNMHKLNSHR